MSDDKVRTAIGRAFSYKTTQISNHTGMCVRLMQHATPGAQTGSGGASALVVGVLPAEAGKEVALGAETPLRALALERGVAAYCADAPRPWRALVFSQLTTNMPILVRPEVGMALACGAVRDTRPLADVVVLVPLDYDVLAAADGTGVLVVRSVYVWTTETASRKRARSTSISTSSSSSSSTDE